MAPRQTSTPSPPRKETTVKKHTAQTITWAIAILLTARLTWTASQHGMPILDTATIGIFALYGVRAGMQNLARSLHTNRQAGGTR